MNPVVITRRTKREAEQAVKQLTERGYEIIFPVTEFASDGKRFKTDSFNRKIFIENSYTSCWKAKLRKVHP